LLKLPQWGIVKAFYNVRQDFLWYKLQAVGIRGQFLTAAKSLYEDVRCAVRVNQELTPWF
jgi:hypothetical protein